MLPGKFFRRDILTYLHPSVFFSVLVVFVYTVSSISADDISDRSLLFYLSGENEFTPDIANGDTEPNYISTVDIISDGAQGSAFQLNNGHLMAYRAPGNIYAERGTLSFFWRSREPLGETPFPIFRASYAEHSSWEFVWLRIDYNGNGFDAFVTDVNLARTRVSVTIPDNPDPDRWIHLALSWDETTGISFYIDGKLAGKKDTTAVFYATLDQFGTAGRIISPRTVSSGSGYLRNGDIDELCIYDRMLSVQQVERCARGEILTDLPPVIRSLDDSIIRNEWFMRYGWNYPENIPPPLDAPSVSVRKVEIHEVYDHKQLCWRANDGFRESTWPYVYNRSRLPGRDDYFDLPDWNCYTVSGKSVTFIMPDELWNHIEISGAAFGSMSLLNFDKELQKNCKKNLFYRPEHRERTFHRFRNPVRGGKLRFNNDIQETPLGEFQAFHVSSGKEPEGIVKLTYALTAKAKPDNPTLAKLLEYINGRFLPDERSLMVALPSRAPRTPGEITVKNPLPLVHILIPFEFRAGNLNRSATRFSYTWENMNGGLDGIAIELPPMKVMPTHGEYFPMNIQVKDPVWPDRTMIDFSFSVRPGEARTLWLDMRDRILPNGKSLYLTIAGAGADFCTESLEGTRVRLVFKDRKEAAIEHELDRFTQVKDKLGFMVEERPNVKKQQSYNRFSEDITDLLRINPDHIPGRLYWSFKNSEQGWPVFKQPEAPYGVPLWAFRQVEYLKLVKEFILWWIDERQIENGEFGGGLSDDGDLTNQWPGAALMGIEPEKITDSVLRLMDAYYEEGLFTDGLNTIQTDQLHVYEEGINVLPQTMLLDYGDPKVVERLLETSGAYERITGINDLGHRQIRSTFYSATKIAQESPWSMVTLRYGHLILHAGLALVEFNGHPATKKLLLELADGILAYRKQDEKGNYYLPSSILFPSGEATGKSSVSRLNSTSDLLWAAWRWTEDSKYLLPLMDETNRGNFSDLRIINANTIDYLGKRDSWGNEIARQISPLSGSHFNRHIAWQMTGNKRFLEEYYAEHIEDASNHMYLSTEAHFWSDRGWVSSQELQRSRLGGVALWRNNIYPGHTVSWKFKAPANDESVAILIPYATTKQMTIIVFNMENTPVTAIMTAWDIVPGKWDVIEGIDTNNDDIPDEISGKRTVSLERTGNLELSFPARKTSVVKLRLKSKAKPYWERSDLGIGKDDVSIRGNSVKVTVHSLGSVNTPTSSAVLLNKTGEIIATVAIPALNAPLDYQPKTAEVTLNVPSGTMLSGCSVTIDPDAKLTEITRRNNSVLIP